MPARRAKGDGSIFWSPTDQAYIGLLELPKRNGKRRRKKFSGPTKAAVKQAMDDARGVLHTAAHETPLDRYLDDWAASHAFTRLRPSTQASYRDTLRLHVRPLLGHEKLITLTPARLDDWLEQLANSRRSIATIRYAKVVLRLALQRAVRRGLLATNPAAVLTVTGGTRRAPTALEAKQVGSLLAAASPWMRVAILISALGGLRRGEVCGLQWDDLDWQAGTVKVERSISAISGQSEPKTVAGKRVVELPALVIRALEGHRRMLEIVNTTGGAHRLPPWIFSATNGKPKHPRNFLHSYERARTAAGFHTVRFHDLRHTCATALLTLGTDPKTVSQVLGHAGVRTTLDMYHHPNLQQRRKGAQALQRWLVDNVTRE